MALVKLRIWVFHLIESNTQIEQKGPTMKTWNQINNTTAVTRTSMTRSIQCLGSIMIFVFVVATATGWSADPKGEASPGHALIGTWKLISAKYDGQESPIPAEATTLKHVTPAQFMWASYDKDGTVVRAAGGSYTIKGDVYEETPQYGISSDFDLIKGKAQTFKWKVEGNKWHHNGKLSNGLTIEEVWERVEKK